MPIIKSTRNSIEEQIEDAVLDSKLDRMKEFKTFKSQLGTLASNLDIMYKTLASNLLPTLLKAHDEAGNSLNKFQHCGEEIKPFDVVFDANTFEKTKNLRSSLYSVVYISKDKKSLLIAKPKPQILRKSKYPNSKVAEPDRYYTKAHLHLEYISRDIRSLNFICHGDNTDLVIFYSDWRPLQMEDYLEDIIKIQIIVLTSKHLYYLEETILISRIPYPYLKDNLKKKK